ncbi:MAG: SH3 domain-containing protein [Roseburia sp.]|nr:SH3 domain-containing protein [Roseburia sp.]
MKKKILPVIAALIFILVVILFMILGKIIDKYSPTDEQQDLGIHYGITSEEEVAIIYNNELIEAKAKLLNDVVYLRVDTVKNYINDRFYWDANENILRYTTATDLISVPAESTNYTITKDSHSLDHIIVKADAETAYIAIDFVKTYSDFAYEIFKEPNRVVITTAWGNYTTTITKKDTELRILGGIKSPILDNLKKGEELTILEELETWTEVITNDGIIGYVKSKNLGNNSTKTLTSDYVPEEFTHIKKDFEINMAWHQVFNRSANSNISSVLQSTKGLNVISPSWFYLKDNNGGIGSLASTDYVNYCHQHNVEVWALVSNFGAKDQGLENPDLTSILTHTSSRDNLVNNLISSAIQYNLDGINIDFESVDPAVGDSYIQFIRELSLKCANNGIVLSVDNYVPTAYTAFYNRSEQALFADYVVIMAYDEHHSGSEPGSVASIGWVTEGIENTMKEVPADQIILGMPFYARVWCLTPADGETLPEDGSVIDSFTNFDISCYSASMGEQKQLANANGITPVWSDEVGQYYVEYKNSGSIYQIWMEDATSIEAKLKVMDSFKLAGGAFWKLGLEQSSVWDTIIKYIN